jgi:hypothetical protein
MVSHQALQQPLVLCKQSRVIQLPGTVSSIDSLVSWHEQGEFAEGSRVQKVRNVVEWVLNAKQEQANSQVILLGKHFWHVKPCASKALG